MYNKYIVLFVCFSLFFLSTTLSGCDNNEKELNSTNNKCIQKINNIEINHLPDPSIYVNEKELSLFTDVQNDFNFTDEDTKKIIRIFKQIGLNFNKKYGIQIEKNSNDINISWNIDHNNIIYIIKSDNPMVKPQISSNGKIINPINGYYIFSFGYNSILKLNDFEIYYYLPDDLYPLYRNGKIINTLENMALRIK